MELVKSREVENIICLPVKENEVEEIVYKIVPGIIELIERIERQTKSRCAGLAAPQVGIKKKFLVRKQNRRVNISKIIYSIYFNSKYKNKSDKRTKSLEGCYSYNMGKKQNYVDRWKRIMFHGYEWNIKQKKLTPVKMRLSGWEAIIMQHEIDHHGNGDKDTSKTIFCR